MKKETPTQADACPTVDITLANGKVIRDVPLLEPTPEQIARAGGSKTRAALLALAQIIEQENARSPRLPIASLPKARHRRKFRKQKRRRRVLVRSQSDHAEVRI